MFLRKRACRAGGQQTEDQGGDEKSAAWAETYERDLGDVLRLQSEVAQAIAQQVRAQLTPQLQARFRSTRPVNPEAYEAYLRGRFYLTNQIY
jgi:hypothetical protein